MKTTKQVAEELQVTIRTIQRHVKRLKITPQKQGTESLLDENAVELIRKAIDDKRQRQETTTATATGDNKNNDISQNVETATATSDTKTATATENSDTEITLLKAQIELLQSEISFLKDQIQVKDKQIDTLSTALTTAQALQGIEKKQNLLVVGADAEEQEEQPQQKQGFFARLFRRKSR